MLIGIISDTHGNLEYFKEIAEFLVKKFKIDKIYHLGDNFSDCEVLKSLNVNYLAVPGIYDPEYKNEKIPNIIVDKINGFQIALVHSLEDLNIKENKYAKCKIICYGHTHNWKIEINDGILYLNPGHLKERYHKDRIATFALISIDNFFIEIKIFDIDKNLLKEERFICI